MDEMKAQQIEALSTAIPYCEKIESALQHIIGEYTEKKLPDTDEYLVSILNGLNWIFGVYNGTQDLINECEVAVDKEAVNNSIVSFNEAKKAADDLAIAEALKGIMQFVKSFREAAASIVK